MTIRIFHAATHGHNIGDGALVAGIHSTLAEDIGEDIEYVPFDVFDSKLSGNRRMLVLDDYATLESEIDAVMVGGGGMIEGNRGSYVSGMNFGFDPRILERSHIPWIFYAIGVNSFRGDRFYHRKRLARTIDVALDSGHIVSLRNDGSLARLADIIGERDSIITVPDPGLWVPPGSSPLPAMNRRPLVVLQMAGDNPRQRGLSSERQIKTIARFVEAIVRRHDAMLILTPHLLIDVSLFARLLARLPNSVVRDNCIMSPVLKGSSAAPAFFEIYRRADLAVGMRGHSLICSIGAGTPAIGIETHDKVRGFMEEIGLPEWSINLEEPGGLERLLAGTSEILDNLDSHRRRTRETLAPLRAQRRQFHGLIANRLGL